jgi:lipopolysaccharide transport system permease protein
MRVTHYSSATTPARIDGSSPAAVITAVSRHWPLILQLAEREIQGRFRGSWLGLLWLVLNPVIILSVYTFVFRQVLSVKWGAAVGSNSEFALILFSGLIIFTLFSDCIVRAPGLLLENPSFVKKVVFPLEALPVTVVGTALFNFAVSLLILAAFHWLIVGPMPWTALLIIPVLLPLLLLLLGLTWLLAALGVYLRDLKQFITGFVTLLMFLSPIFYPLSAVPVAMQPLILFNPLTFIIEQARLVLLVGQPPDWLGLGLYLLAGWLTAWLGLLWFRRTQRGFADVI